MKDDERISDAAVAAIEAYADEPSEENGDKVIGEMMKLLDRHVEAIVESHRVLEHVLDETGYKFTGPDREMFLKAKALGLACAGRRLMEEDL